jgi:hypothetical protein
MTPKDVEMFRVLSNSAVGTDLAEYLDRLLGKVCDSRNWGPDETKETAQKVASIIQKDIIDKIRLVNKAKPFSPNEHE